MYYQACSVLLKEEDFYDLMSAYLQRAAQDGVHVAEIFFDPQTHTERGIPFDIVINGLHRALVNGYRDFNIKGSLIMCFLRHLPQDKHMATLQDALPHLDKIIAVGLDSGEIGNQPHKFTKVFAEAGRLGLKIVAHAGEEGGPEYIKEALDLLHAKRIDHGVQCLFDDELVKRLVKQQIPLTVCPLSNKKLQVNSRYFGGKNQTKTLLDKELMVTINSDDPAYFGGYITDNFLVTAAETGMIEQDIYKICCNAFNATFLPLVEKENFLRKLRQFNVQIGLAAPPKSVTIFGSRSPQLDSPEYEIACRTAALFSSSGYRIVNGGYSGIMKAASHGANENGGIALGVLVPRTFTKRSPQGNSFLTHRHLSQTFFDRISYLVTSSEYFIVFPGTIGTITELMITWNTCCLGNNQFYPPKKLYIYREPFATALTNLISALGISKDDQEHLVFFDQPEEILRLVENDYEERQKKATFKYNL